MENGVAVVEGSHTEGKLVENEGLDSVVDETRLVESNGSNDSEEDEVFEEAVGAEIPLDHVQDVVVANGDDTVDSDELSGDDAMVDEKTGSGNDLEKFEETIGVPLSVDNEEDNLPVHVEDTVETLVHTELVNDSELHGAVDESDNLPKSELGETEKIVPISSDEQVGGEISEANSTGEVGSLEDGNQNDQKSEIVVQTGENGVQESTNLPEVEVQEKSDVGTTTEEAVKADEEPEAEDSVIVAEGDSDSVLTKSTEENLYPDQNGEEGKESLGLSDTDHKDSEIVVKEDPVVSDSLTDKEEVKDQSVVIDKLPEDDQSNVPKEEISSNAVHLDGNDLKEDVKDIVNSRLENLDDRELDHASVTTDSDHLVMNGESENKTHPTAEEPGVTPEVEKLPASENSGVVETDEKNESKTHPTAEEPEVTPEVDKLPTSEDSGLVKMDEKTEDKTHSTAEEPEVIPEVDIVPISEDSGVVKIHSTAEEEPEVIPEVDIVPTSEDSGVVMTDEKTEKLPISDDTTVVEIVEKVDELPTPRDLTLVEADKITGATDLDVAVGSKSEGSKREFVDKDVEASTVEVKEPETKGVIHEEVRRSVQENREAEIKPAAVFLPSRKPADQAPTPARPAGLGSAAPLLEPSRVVQQPRVNGTSSHTQTQLVEEPLNGEAEENDETREKLQMIRVKFLRLAHRLGQTPHNVVVAQVLYRLGLAEQLRGRNGGRVGAFSFDRASAMAEQLEAAGQEPLDFSCTIMVLGKSGVGKSATINSIFDEAKFGTDAFQLGTKKVQDVVGTVQGIKVRVIDTPGLLPSWSDQRQNEKILHSVKRFIKKTPPDIVLYLDRLDMQSRDFGDMPLLRTITDIFGPSIWFNAIVVLTHAASAPPEGPNGTATSYDMFVTQRSHVVQQAIRQAAGDMRLMNPVSLVENHSACRTNRAGQRVLPNGQVWKPHLLLLSFASKILAEANTLLKLQDSPPGRPFATRTRAPPLPFLLSSLLQSRPQLKLPEEQFGDDDTLDDDLDESSDSDDESAYDELPPFKRLSKAQLAKLTKAQKRAYHDELEYREKLFMKKQLKEEKKRRRFMKKMAESAKDLPSEYSENVEESGGAASVPVPMPDLALPASFDADNPTHRYRYLDSPNQWVVRPVLDTHGWDHDIGYEGVNVEKVFAVKQEIPVSFSGQVTKDKKDSNLQMEISSSLKHGKDKATSLGLEMQTLGKDMVYTLRSETRFSNYRRNQATAGLSVTLLGDALTAGVKIEDKLIANKRFRMVVSGGAMAGRGDVAYGGSLEATLRDKDHPLGRSLTTLGLSVMDWHGDLAIGGNLQSQIPIGRSTNLIARANLNNRSSGQVSIRLNSSEQLQIALVALLPLLRKLYPQQLQFGQW